jgi:hypothetical protein
MPFRRWFTNRSPGIHTMETNIMGNVLPALQIKLAVQLTVSELKELTVCRRTRCDAKEFFATSARHKRACANRSNVAQQRSKLD